MRVDMYDTIALFCDIASAVLASTSLLCYRRSFTTSAPLPVKSQSKSTYQD